MTTVRIDDKSTVKISINGHADYNPGNDIVCAGISTLSYTLLNFLFDASARNIIHTFKYRSNPGDIYLEFKKQRWDTKEINAAIRMFRTGMEMIESQYPDHIKVEVIS